ncbi:AraC family transcriptional regulator [Heliorestis acidaminivorans]|uniref:AraC family transcriptional regulator n=1 Tax=Heliorestis acidaminivorans TaxID=553427 RepID=A0A6I0EV10_9FIRM|nr:CD1247 N-terminal domain-containing protein [Heliorestis acidaminivorans]KAB2951668.1 AraC family transcriptional regulator [Heliorestis acidaminivorans]
MPSLKERISYIKGMAEGLKIEADPREGRLLSEMINLLGKMADEIDEVKREQVALEEMVESIDEDLVELESDFYELDDDDDFDDDDDDDDVFLCQCDHDHDEEDDELIEFECPTCEETVCFDQAELADDEVLEVVCPSCDRAVYIQDGEDLDMTAFDEDDDDEIEDNRQYRTTEVDSRQDHRHDKPSDYNHRSTYRTGPYHPSHYYRN